MALITLTSDLGTRDPYLATVKGRLLRHCSDAQLLDITHDIEPLNSAQAAYALSMALPHFPPDTIHWIGLRSQQVRNLRFLIAVQEGQIVIGPDDGFFSLLFATYPEFLFAIRPGCGQEAGFAGVHADTVFACAHLACNGDLSHIADAVRNITELNRLQAAEGEDFIRGSAVAVDRFGNVAFNITRHQVERAARGRTWYLHLLGRYRIDQISNTYQDVVPGEILALYNHAGFLEIAVNQGSAQRLLGLRNGSSIQLRFEGEAKPLEEESPRDNAAGTATLTTPA
jgi:S-adenosyl-L-methionine hydrolase (adenosine-forming)